MSDSFWSLYQVTHQWKDPAALTDSQGSCRKVETAIPAKWQRQRQRKQRQSEHGGKADKGRDSGWKDTHAGLATRRKIGMPLHCSLQIRLRSPSGPMLWFPALQTVPKHKASSVISRLVQGRRWQQSCLCIMNKVLHRTSPRESAGSYT